MSNMEAVEESREIVSETKVVGEAKTVTGTAQKATTKKKTTAKKATAKKATVKKATAKKATAKKAAPKKATAKKVTKKVTAKKATKPAPKKAKAKKDDLTKIEGIGPKIAGLLNKDGIHTFAELGKAKITVLKGILEKGGPRYKMHNPGSWPKQSKLAAAGKWDALKKLQDELDGGR